MERHPGLSELLVRGDHSESQALQPGYADMVAGIDEVAEGPPRMAPLLNQRWYGPGEGHGRTLEVVVGKHPYQSESLLPRGANAAQCARTPLVEESLAGRGAGHAADKGLLGLHAYAVPQLGDVAFPHGLRDEVNISRLDIADINPVQLCHYNLPSSLLYVPIHSAA